MKLAHVRWTDSTSLRGWKKNSEIEKFCQSPPEKMTSVGFLIHECSTHIILVQSISKDCKSDAIKIPMEAIEEITVL